MRFAERFLVVLVLISLILRFAGIKDGLVLEIISVPLLALLYLLALPVLAGTGYARTPGVPGHAGRLLLYFLSGLVIAYCLLSMLYFTLESLPRRDMLENCSLLLGLLLAGLGIGWWRRRSRALSQLALRAALLLAAILVISLLPLPRFAGR